jgi:hypothetical protein
MNSVKRLGMTALLVVLAVLLAASPALAGKYADPLISSTTYELAPPVDADAPEPTASGKWTLDVYALGWEDVTVSCRRLTPGEQYVVVSLVQWSETVTNSGGTFEDSGSYLEEHPVTADTKGRLNAKFYVYSEADTDWFRIYRLSRHVADVWIVNATTGEIVLEEYVFSGPFFRRRQTQ